MTATIDRPSQAPDELLDAPGPPAVTPGTEPAPTGRQAPPPLALGDVVRPLLAAALTSGAAGLMVGGIFGSWPARLLGLGSALFGVGWTAMVLRSRRRTILQLLIVPVTFVLGVLSLLLGSDPSKLGSLVSDAVSSGRLLRPPVPFDPGWRPIIIVLLAMIGFCASWVGTAMQRPQLGFALPLPALILTAISQPKEGELLAGLLAFVPVLLALAVLFAGDRSSMSELSSQFELKRALHGAPFVVGAVVLLLVLNNSSFLFPDPAYDASEKPQKPRAIPLGEVRDRVLFEIESPITGPWKTGILDVYDGESWRLPAFDAERLEDVGRSGSIDDAQRPGDVSARFIVRDLGSGATLPGVVGPVSVETNGASLVYDPRVGVFRVPEGRVEAGLEYTMTLPAYPTAAQLQAVGVSRSSIDPELLEIPDPPPAVEALLAEAPTAPWDRLEFLRGKLMAVVIAVGAGAPDKAVPPETVEELLVGSHEGSPFEIVAAEAMLARWAGIPSRIAYGFDKGQVEGGVTTIRPKNGANWLEVHFDGYGWIPLIGAPPKAKASLDADPNAKFDETIVPSDDVAVEIYIPIRLEDLLQLYERIRAIILSILPWALGIAAAYLAFPALRRAQRRRKRRAWAALMGPREQIAVEYAELRDLATDLNVGTVHDTPLDYLDKVVVDDDHTELAWLVTRSMFGDLAETVDDVDVKAAEELSLSLRRRMFRAQPFQSRVLGVLSRASLREPYTLEVPTVRQVRLPRPSLRSPAVAVSRVARRSASTRRRPSEIAHREEIVMGYVRTRASGVVLVLALASSACGTGGPGEVQIGLKRVAVDLAFKNANAAKTPPAEALRPLPVASQAELANALPRDAFRTPRFAPIEAGNACATAPANARPQEPVTVGIKEPPLDGLYRVKNAGTFKVEGGQFPIQGPVPPSATRIVRNIGKIDTTNALGETTTDYDFEVFQPGAGDNYTLTTYRIKPAQLQMLKRVTKTAQGEVTFTPQPPIQLVGWATSEGTKWNSAGSDAATGTSMVVNGIVESRQAVDVCGELFETFRVRSSEQVTNLAQGFTSSTHDRSGPCAGLAANAPPEAESACASELPTNVYNVATHRGGLFIQEEIHTVTRTGTLTITLDYTSTFLSLVPEPVPASEAS